MRKELMEKIALDLLMCPSLDDIAQSNNISLTTLYKLRKQEPFKKVLREKKNEFFQGMADKMQGYSMESLETLMLIIRNPGAKDSDRINAIRIILDGAGAAHERDEIIPRLEETEKAMEELMAHLEDNEK